MGQSVFAVTTVSGTWCALADKALDVMESGCQSCFDFDPFGFRVLSIPVPMLELMIRGETILGCCLVVVFLRHGFLRPVISLFTSHVTITFISHI